MLNVDDDMIEEAVDDVSKAAGVKSSGNVFGESEHSSSESSSDDDEDESNEDETPAAELDDDELWEILAALLFFIEAFDFGNSFLWAFENFKLVWLMYSVLVLAVVVDVVSKDSLGK